MTSSAVGPSVRPHGPTTGRTRRHHSDPADTPAYGSGVVSPAPPPLPVKPPRPLAELATASVDVIVALAGDQCSDSSHAARTKLGMRVLLERLSAFPGATWQQRWESAGLNDHGNPVGDLAGDNETLRSRVNGAAELAYCMRVIRPSLEAFTATKHLRYSDRFRRIANDPLLEDFSARVMRAAVSLDRRQQAIFQVCAALTVFGIALADLTPEGLLHYVNECHRYRAAVSPRKPPKGFVGGLAWGVLYEMGAFPPLAPRSLSAARTRGQRTIEELVDRFDLRNTAVRGLLIDYLHRRSVELDYSTMDNLVRNLAGLFWKTIEDINPDQVDLRLDEHTVQAWKERVAVRRNGQKRTWLDGVYLAVRALYLDLHTWSAAEPERWARWVAPSPIRDTDLRQFHIRRRRLSERMANRTRQRQPLLPILSQYVNDRWHRLRTVLDAARNVAPGECFVVESTTWQRTSTQSDRENRDHPGTMIRVINRDTGDLVRLSQEEYAAFWQRAVVETLRLAGLRVEELCELTHLSVRNYRRPNGEVVALLVVGPSKSDRERVIPMSGELFHVIAQVIRRLTTEHGTVPICVGYDMAERAWSDPMPFLFQHMVSGSPRAMSTRTVRQIVAQAVETLIPTHPEFAEVRFAPHDFRRLLATELVNNGLPIHVGAALLGHLDVQTTRGYVAVFPEDVVKHYQQFLDRRRSRRPDGEYRQPTTDEWHEFQEHFDRRRVELGSCGRPYGTPCAHEHACIRCPMLSISPKMLPRLDELESDLLARRKRALAENWGGEIEGIDLTLTFLRSKRNQAQRALATGPVALGLPAVH